MAGNTLAQVHEKASPLRGLPGEAPASALVGVLLARLAAAAQPAAERDIYRNTRRA